MVTKSHMRKKHSLPALATRLNAFTARNLRVVLLANQVESPMRASQLAENLLRNTASPKVALQRQNAKTKGLR
jgi:hypothetical protein